MFRLGVPTDLELEYFYQGSEGARMEEGPQLLNMADCGTNILKNSTWDPSNWIPTFEECKEYMKPVRQTTTDTVKYLEAVWSSGNLVSLKGSSEVDKVIPKVDDDVQRLAQQTADFCNMYDKDATYTVENGFVNRTRNIPDPFLMIPFHEDSCFCGSDYKCERCKKKSLNVKQYEGSFCQYGNEMILSTLVMEGGGDLSVEYLESKEMLIGDKQPHLCNQSGWEEESEGDDLLDVALDVVTHSQPISVWTHGAVVTSHIGYVQVEMLLGNVCVERQYELLDLLLFEMRPYYVHFKELHYLIDLDDRYVPIITLRYSKLMNGSYNPYGNEQLNYKQFKAGAIARGITDERKIKSFWDMQVKKKRPGLQTKKKGRRRPRRVRQPAKAEGPTQGMAVKTRPVRGKYEAGVGVSAGPVPMSKAGPESRLAPCTAAYAGYLIQPFTALGNRNKMHAALHRRYGGDLLSKLPCIPSFPSLPSYKFMAVQRGSLVVVQEVLGL